LPPAEKLNPIQTQNLVIAIFNALLAYGINISVPGNSVPAKVVYNELLKEYKKGFVARNNVVIDFYTEIVWSLYLFIIVILIINKKNNENTFRLT